MKTASRNDATTDFSNVIGQEEPEKKNRTLDQQEITLGDFLRNRRLERGFTIELIEEITHIIPSFIRAIEEGNWAIYASKTYAKGHVRSYAEAVGLSSEEILSRFGQELDRGFPETALYRNHLLSVSMRMKRVF